MSESFTPVSRLPARLSTAERVVVAEEKLQLNFSSFSSLPDGIGPVRPLSLYFCLSSRRVVARAHFIFLPLPLYPYFFPSLPLGRLPIFLGDGRERWRPVRFSLCSLLFPLSLPFHSPDTLLLLFSLLLQRRPALLLYPPRKQALIPSLPYISYNLSLLFRTQIATTRFLLLYSRICFFGLPRTLALASLLSCT